MNPIVINYDIILQTFKIEADSLLDRIEITDGSFKIIKFKYPINYKTRIEFNYEETYDEKNFLKSMRNYFPTIRDLENTIKSVGSDLLPGKSISYVAGRRNAGKLQKTIELYQYSQKRAEIIFDVTELTWSEKLEVVRSVILIGVILAAVAIIIYTFRRVKKIDSYEFLTLTLIQIGLLIYFLNFYKENIKFRFPWEESLQENVPGICKHIMDESAIPEKKVCSFGAICGILISLILFLRLFVRKGTRVPGIIVFALFSVFAFTLNANAALYVLPVIAIELYIFFSKDRFFSSNGPLIRPAEKKNKNLR